MRKSDNVKIPKFVENNDLHYIGRGIECQVFEIVKRRLVCKIYSSSADARYNYILQRIAYRHGIGPQPVGLERNYYFSRYIESYDKMGGLDSYSKLPFSKPRFHKLSQSAEYQGFLDKVQDIFGGWGDSHSGNIGIIYVNGKRKFMVIDFGIAGFVNTDLGYKLAKKLELSYD